MCRENRRRQGYRQFAVRWIADSRIRLRRRARIILLARQRRPAVRQEDDKRGGTQGYHIPEGIVGERQDISSGMLFNDSGFSQGPKPCNGAVPVLVEPTRHEVLRRRTGHRIAGSGAWAICFARGCSSNFDLIPSPPGGAEI